jgi:hypothetical protein
MQIVYVCNWGKNIRFCYEGISEYSQGFYHRKLVLNRDFNLYQS